LHLIIIFEDIANEFAVGDIEVALLDFDGLDEPPSAVLVPLLILLHLTVGLLDIGKPFHNLPRP
jgi:hypothetical protein